MGTGQKYMKILTIGTVTVYCAQSVQALSIMLFYPTIGSKCFVKTQTYVALFGPHELSLIFSGGMCLELTSL